MENVGPGLGGHVDHATGITSVLGADVIGGDTKFLYDVLRRYERVKVAGYCIRRDAVNKERALVPEAATDRVIAEPNGVCSGTAALVVDCIAIRAALCDYTWHQRQHVVHVSSAQRNALDLFLANGCPKRCAVRLQRRRFGGHENCLADITDLQGSVYTSRDVNLHFDFVLREVLKAGHLNVNLIKSGYEVGECIEPTAAGLHRAGLIGSKIG